MRCAAYNTFLRMTHSGKSTLLRVMLGVWQPASGTVLPVVRGPSGVVALPQSPYIPLCTLRQLLWYPGPPKCNGCDSSSPDVAGGLATTYSDEFRAFDGTILELLQVLGLEHLLRVSGSHKDQTLAESLSCVAPWRRILSGGEAQRVGIIRVLLSGAAICVCDESTSALDPALQVHVHRKPACLLCAYHSLT